MTTSPAEPRHAGVPVLPDPANGSVPRDRPREREQAAATRQRGKGRPFDPERAREVALAREAAKRARRLAATFPAKAASAAQVPDIPGLSGDRAPVLAPALRIEDLIEGPGGTLRLPGGDPSRRPIAPPGAVSCPAQASGSLTDRPGAPPVEPEVPVEGQESASGPVAVRGGGAGDANRRDVESEMTRQARLAEEYRLQREAEVQAEVERDMAAREASRVARAKLDLAKLMDRIAHPERAENSLPWAPACPPAPGRCEGCGRNFHVSASDRPGHAVEAANQQPPRMRCVRWALGLP